MEACQTSHLTERSPFIDLPMITKASQEDISLFFTSLEERPSPRVIKTHLPFELLPEGLEDRCRVIFVSRNVKDVVVSFYHFQGLGKHLGLNCDFLTFARDIYQPSLTLDGGYFQMLESGWQRRASPNVLFLWYEEMKSAGQTSIIRSIADHLGATVSDEQIEKIDDFVKFENYKKKSAVNKPSAFWKEGKGEFVRKGQVGDWVNMFSPELTAEYDAWIREELARLDITDPQIVGYFQLQE